MIQIVEKTYEEEVEMYMKMSKRVIIEMLIECHKYLPQPYITAYKNAGKLIATPNTGDWHEIDIGGSI